MEARGSLSSSPQAAPETSVLPLSTTRCTAADYECDFTHEAALPPLFTAGNASLLPGREPTDELRCVAVMALPAGADDARRRCGAHPYGTCHSWLKHAVRPVLPARRGLSSPPQAAPKLRILHLQPLGTMSATATGSSAATHARWARMAPSICSGASACAPGCA